MDSLHAFLTEQAALCRAQAAALTADQRGDEAIFEKIRCNVFEIFASVLKAAGQQPEPMAFFRRQLDTIPANWEAAYQKAKAHGDDGRAHTELVKLEAVRIIRARLEAEA